MTADIVDKVLFKCEGLPNFNQFTPQRIEKEFPVLIEKLNSDFNDIETEFSSLITNENLDWGNVMNPLNKINEENSVSMSLKSEFNFSSKTGNSSSIL